MHQRPPVFPFGNFDSRAGITVTLPRTPRTRSRRFENRLPQHRGVASTGDGNHRAPSSMQVVSSGRA